MSFRRGTSMKRPGSSLSGDGTLPRAAKIVKLNRDEEAQRQADQEDPFKARNSVHGTVEPVAGGPTHDDEKLLSQEPDQ